MKSLSLRIALLLGLLIFIAGSWYAWRTYRGFSLRAYLQRILDDHKIPVEIKSLLVDARSDEMFRGKIKQLDLIARHKISGIEFRIKSGIEYKLSGRRIEISLHPRLQVHTAGLPAFEGPLKLAIEFDPLTRGLHSRLQLEKVEVDFDLASEGGYDHRFDFGLLKAGSIRVKNSAVIDILSSPPVHADLSVTIVKPFFESRTVTLSEEELSFRVKGNSDGQELDDLDLHVLKPIPVSVTGSVSSTQKIKARFKLGANVDDILGRLQRLIHADIFERLYGSGALEVTGSLAGTLQHPRILGNLQLNAEYFEITDVFEDNSLMLDGFRLSTPFSYPLSETEGTFSIENVDAFYFKTRQLKFRLLSSASGIAVEHPGSITIPFLSSRVYIRDLKARVPLNPDQSSEREHRIPGIAFPILASLSLTSDPFRLAELQKAFCILPKKPIDGSLQFNYPKVFNAESGLHVLGQTDITAFNGSVRLNDVRYYWQSGSPRLKLDLRWSDLDLHAIGAYSNFGDMRGSLDGHLTDAQYVISRKIGLYPVEYDFMVRGNQRAGKPVRFYGRAVNNIMELLGSPNREVPGAAKWIMDKMLSFRNWFPAEVDYMGFRAKTTGQYTELSTFDPPEEKEKHYILRAGSTFNIPLNTHGVYPMILESSAFHDWMLRQVDYLKSLGRTTDGLERRGPDDCMPFWAPAEEPEYTQ